MGYYLNDPDWPAVGKAEKILSLDGTEEIPAPLPFSAIPEGKALVCVMNNRIFEGAGLIYSERELRDFTEPDDMRPRRWLLVDRETAHRMSGYKEIS